MSTPLLTTKLYIPHRKPQIVPRQRLIDNLNAGLHNKLTLISAPAGFGKTTLVAEWIRETNRSAAWISLDNGDNILSRFLSYFVAAIQSIKDGFGSDVMAILQANENPALDTLLTLLINQIASIGNDLILVLDDYHLVSDQSIHAAIEFLSEHLPPNLHLVIASRANLPFSLSRLRVGGQLSELRANDLRFSEEEIAVFLNKIMGFDLAQKDIQALKARTEGWIASLQLAALSLQGREDKEDFIAAFSGSHHYVIDYLVDEVMSRQSEENQQFLCRTSILERFCASLCDFVLEISDSKHVIQGLETANLFLIPLDDQRNWYRYHHLFADFLRLRLAENEPDSIPTLHGRASKWFDQNGFMIEAIDHALEGKDYTRVAQLMERVGPEMMMQNQFDQLDRWLNAMPQNLVESWPWLCIIRAWMCDRWAQFDIGERYLQHAEASLAGAASESSKEAKNIIRGQISAIRALYSLKKAQIPESIEYSNQALSYLPRNYFNRGVASFTLGWSKRAQGDLSGAIQAYEEGRRASLAAGNLILAQVIILDMGEIQFLWGHLHRAADTMREAIQLKYEGSEIRIPYASSASIGLARILREWNELDAALRHLEEGIELGVASKVVDAVALGYASCALVHLAKGDLDKANQASNQAEQMVKDIPDLETETLSRILDARIRLLLAQDKLTQADKCLQERGSSAGAEIGFSVVPEHIAWVRVAIHSGRENPASQALSDAHKLLVNMLEMTKSAGFMNRAIEILVLQAMAFEAQEEYDLALHSLEEALTLAESEGYVRTFIDQGDPMRGLLRLAASHGIAQNYVNTLLATFDPYRASRKPGVTQSIVHPLSEREMEVLKMLDTELTGREIADHLMVSLNTMRTHTKNIYSKLGVNSRRAAVRRANELGLL